MSKEAAEKGEPKVEERVKARVDLIAEDWELIKHDIRGSEAAPWDNFAHMLKEMPEAQRPSFMAYIATKFGNEVVQNTVRAFERNTKAAASK